MKLIISAFLCEPPSNISCFRDVTLYGKIYVFEDILLSCKKGTRSAYWEWLKSYGAHDFISYLILDEEKELLLQYPIDQYPEKIQALVFEMDTLGSNVGQYAFDVDRSEYGIKSMLKENGQFSVLASLDTYNKGDYDVSILEFDGQNNISNSFNMLDPGNQIATGFNMPKVISETDTIENSETASFEPPRTNHLQEIENKPLHAQKEDPNRIKEKKEAKGILTFDDTSESSVIYGKDLQIPAFIRRQHD